jgi:hypothetical protein
MKSLTISLAIMFGAFAACGGDSATTCPNNNCTCEAGCDVACVTGAGPCNIGCSGAQPCMVACVGDAPCNVECAPATTCDVDCANSASCFVHCPISGCRVENCAGVDCEVTCGTNGVGNRNGTTVTCP